MNKIITLINSRKWDIAYNLLNTKNKNKINLDSIIFDSNTFIHVCAIRGNIKMIMKIAKSYPELLFLSNQHGFNVLFFLKKL